VGPLFKASTACWGFFMMAYCYILYSPTINRFYVGSTELEPEQRLELHNIQYYGDKKFTARANDWALFLEIQCNSVQQARKIESHIKRMKSKTYIKNLKKYPELREKLIAKY
jgi:putative endonuclease